MSRDSFRPGDFDLDDRGRPVPTWQPAEEGAGAPASIAQRAGAHLFDVVVVVLMPGYPLWVQLLLVGLPAVYEIGLVARRGRTVGMGLFGIEVVRRLDGGRPTLGMSAIRFLVTAVQYTGLVPFVLLVAGIYLTATWHPERRGIHDRASGTVVVRMG